jgi:membrane peptidoglycan carboxypeptidase
MRARIAAVGTRSTRKTRLTPTSAQHTNEVSPTEHLMPASATKAEHEFLPTMPMSEFPLTTEKMNNASIVIADDSLGDTQRIETDLAAQFESATTHLNSDELDASLAPLKNSQQVKKKRRIWPFITLIFLICFSVLAWAVWQESRTYEQQAAYFSKLAKQLTYKVEAGASPAEQIRYPQDSPYDERLGYSNLPLFLSKLEGKDYSITAQARISPKMAEMADRGYFATYHEKNGVGLSILDQHQQALFVARYPERMFASFQEIPKVLIDSLLFIENRELLDPKYPKRNPAVEWDRLSKAVFDKSLNMIGGGQRTAGGSTLATQIEKYRHSAEGRTHSLNDKFNQMVSASLRAYQGGEDTRKARQEIVLNYINSVPLSAKPGYGEVNGIGDGLWVWYGRDFTDIRHAFMAKVDSPEYALAFKQALSLFIAQRRPSYYLDAGRADLEQLSDAHLRLLAQAGMISVPLRDAALKVKIHSLNKTAVKTPASFVTRKASNAVRNHLANLLGDANRYSLDRLDLVVQSTMNAQMQQAVTAALQDLRTPEAAQAAGLTGKGMLGKGDPAKVVYSFTLLEKGEQFNYLRVQTDNYDQPLDINDGAKLDLGSTAKLRTLITYLDIIAQLHQRYSAMTVADLDQVQIDQKDKISQWAVEFFKTNQEKDLSNMLTAALERKYSASPGEGFFTGGGLHYFGNFKKEDNGKIMTIREALRHSVNLPFVRLMRDVVHFYMFQAPNSSAGILSNVKDERRADYLSRFADREGREFLQRFYAKYKNKNAQEAVQILLANLHPTPNKLASIHRTIAPKATLGEFEQFLNQHLLSQREVSTEQAGRLYTQYSSSTMSLSDRGYLANIHPLELWIVAYLRENPKANLSDAIAASSQERQIVYEWLFKTSRKHAQDKRIAGLLEVEAFLEVHRQWQRMGYPFASMTPSYASALGASADRPSALAEMMGILINDGLRKPTQRISSLHFASGTPYETLLNQNRKAKSEQVLAPEVARVVVDAVRDVVANGTARRVKSSFVGQDGQAMLVGGKTGTGDQRFDVYAAGGRLIESRFVNRSATFVFAIGDRYFGSMTAYVQGPDSENYDFTSALPVQLLSVLAPTLMKILDPAPEPSKQISQTKLSESKPSEVKGTSLKP